MINRIVVLTIIAFADVGQAAEANQTVGANQTAAPVAHQNVTTAVVQPVGNASAAAAPEAKNSTVPAATKPVPSQPANSTNGTSKPQVQVVQLQSEQSLARHEILHENRKAENEHLTFTPPSDQEEADFHEKLRREIEESKKNKTGEDDAVFVIDELPILSNIEEVIENSNLPGDFVEEKVTPSGEHIRKEVHRDPNGLTSVVIESSGPGVPMGMPIPIPSPDEMMEEVLSDIMGAPPPMMGLTPMDLVPPAAMVPPPSIAKPIKIETEHKNENSTTPPPNKPQMAQTRAPEPLEADV